MLAQLLYRPGAERVGRRDGHGKLCALQHVGDLCKAGRLARPVDPDKDDHVRLAAPRLPLGGDQGRQIDRAGLVEH